MDLWEGFNKQQFLEVRQAFVKYNVVFHAIYIGNMLISILDFLNVGGNLGVNRFLSTYLAYEPLSVSIKTLGLMLTKYFSRHAFGRVAQDGLDVIVQNSLSH